MSAELLASVSGILLSLIFSYTPGLNAKYDALATTQKRLIMLGALVVVSAGAFGLACVGWFGVPVTCDQAGAEQLASAFVLALVANQGTYLITKG